jgi:DNA-binding Lrp family transcriptional regulator
MLQVGKRRSQARETAESSAANKRFRNLNSAILMQRLTMSGEVIRLGLNSTHLAVVQVIAAHTPRDGWRLEGEGASERIVSGEAYPTQATIAEKVGRSERRVGAMVTELVSAGLLVRKTVTIRKADPLAGELVSRRCTYRVSIPTFCAADGAEGVRDALAETSQLRIRRPDTSLDTMQETHGGTCRKLPVPPDADFRFDPSKTSEEPSVTSEPSLSAAAAAAPSAIEKECDGITTPDGGTGTVRLVKSPEGTRHGSGTLVPCGTIVAIPREAWNLAHDGRGDALGLALRRRPEGTEYLWLDKKPRQRSRQGRENRRADVPSPFRASEGVSSHRPSQSVQQRTLTAKEIRCAIVAPTAGRFSVMRIDGEVFQIDPSTLESVKRNEIQTVTMERTAHYWREMADEIPF